MKRKHQAEDDLRWLHVAWLSMAPGDRFRLGGEPSRACPDPSCGLARTHPAAGSEAGEPEPEEDVSYRGSGAAEASYCFIQAPGDRFS